MAAPLHSVIQCQTRRQPCYSGRVSCSHRRTGRWAGPGRRWEAKEDQTNAFLRIVLECPHAPWRPQPRQRRRASSTPAGQKPANAQLVCSKSHLASPPPVPPALAMVSICTGVLYIHCLDLSEIWKCLTVEHLIWNSPPNPRVS